GAWEKADELVVVFRDGAPAAGIDAAARRLGLQFLADSAGPGPVALMRARVAPGSAPAILAQLRRDPNVEAADTLHYYAGLWKPNDPRYKEQWNFDLIHMEKAWDVTRGKGAVVAVIDTGVAIENDAKCYRAKDFADTKYVRGYDFIAKDDHPNDDNGH